MRHAKLLTALAAAKKLKVQEQTLRTWRFRGVGPRSIKIKNRVYYSEKDLKTFIKTNGEKVHVMRYSVT